MSRYQLIIFDFDGTLAITHPAIISCAIKTFQTFNIKPPTEEQIQSVIGVPLAEAFTIFHPAIATEEIPQWIETYRLFYQTEGLLKINLFSGVKQVIHAASSEGLNLVIVSVKHTKFLNLALKELKINSYFDLVIGDYGQTPIKPDSSVFYSAIQPIYPDIQSNEVLVVGDSHVDLLFAKNAGLDVCWAAYGYGDRAKCLALNPTFVVNDISELISIIQKE